MAIYRNGELANNKKDAPDGVRQHILTGAKINDSLSDCISQNAHYASIINAVIAVVNLDEVYDGTKIKMISAILEGVQNG